MREKKTLSGLGIEGLLVDIANRSITLHPVKREWKVAIIILILFRLLTAVISIFAAYYFFLNYILLVVPYRSVAIFVTVLFLIVIEFLSNQFLSKLFKFAFRKRWKTALSIIPVVIIFYAVSFISSTNGLANYANSKVLNSTPLDSLYNSKIDSLNALKQSEILTYQKAINEIRANPQGWKNGQRIILLDWQLQQIDNYLAKIDAINQKYDNKINELKSELQTKKSHIKAKALVTAKKYYKFVSIVLLFQILVTGLLTFFLFLIRTQESKDSVISEDLAYIRNTVENNALETAQATVIASSNRFAEILANALNYSFFFRDYKPISMIAEHSKSDNELQKKQIGFQIDSQEKNLSEKTPETSARASDKNQFQTINFEYLIKHKKLISAIKKVITTEKPSLSNSEVRKIQEIAVNAPFKSATTIRNVYETIKVIGLNHFDENGNFIIPKTNSYGKEQ